VPDPKEPSHFLMSSLRISSCGYDFEVPLGRTQSVGLDLP
jgi:hypothetical protein